MIALEQLRLSLVFRRAAILSCFATGCSQASSPAADDATVPDDGTDVVDANAQEQGFVFDFGGDITLCPTETGDPGLTGACAPLVPDAALEASALCYRQWELPCGIPADVEAASGCSFSVCDCAKLCNYPAQNCQVVSAACVTTGTGDAAVTSIATDVDAAMVILCDVCVTGGRRPERLASTRVVGRGRDLGGYFASLAHLEAASVPAFRRMVGDLRVFGAPREIVRGACSAARDEVRHARVTTRLARRFGVEPRAPRIARVDRAARRSLEAFARDNEIEGCVRETFAACLLRVQSERASDADVRRQLAHIAVDETKHAALSWAISRWARTKLSTDARVRLDRARDEEIARLEASLGRVTGAAAQGSGAPPIAEQRRLLSAMRASLWSA